MTLRESLLAMGYHESAPHKWLKPIGYQCFSFNEDQNRWACWFLNKQGEVSCWQSRVIKVDETFAGDFLSQLKYFECYTRIDVGGGNPNSHFELNNIFDL